MNTQDYIRLDETYCAHNYHPIPVVIVKGEGAKVWDPEGREYYDFLSAYSAVTQGHRHPKIIGALIEQAGRCTLTSRAFHNDVMGPYLKKLCEYTGFDVALPMNTGAEAVETALKTARRWGVEKKGIVNGKQEIICMKNNFHGRTITIVSMSTDEESRVNYGPYTPGFVIVDYNDAKAIEEAITENTCAVILEPIQGEAGVCVPDEGYLSCVREICTKHDVLMIVDEVQTGFCRTGKKFAVDHENVKPDMMALGKALGGGVIPVSAVVGNKEVMDIFTPGSHGSTFGGYSIACAVAKASLEVLEEENLAENAEKLGKIFREELSKVDSDRVVQVRGKGLLNAVVFEEGYEAYDVCIALKEKGVLAKQTHGHIIRFAPPLVITEEELMDAVNIIKGVLEAL